MTDFTPHQLQQMEQEAIQRLKEMQQRAQKTAEQQGWTGSIPDPPSSPPENPPPQAPPSQEPPTQPPSALEAALGLSNSPLSGLLQRVGGERGVLLALLALLMGEGADPTLLLALFWLAMGEGGNDDG